MEAAAVALFASLAPTITALAAWRRAVKVDGNMGQANGAGPVHEVLASVQCRLDRIERRLNSLDRSGN